MKITTKNTIGMGVLLAGGMAAFLVAGCTDPAKQASTQQIVAVLCAQDAILQPLTSAVVSATAPAAAAAAATESLLVHPAVLAACAAEHAVPVAVATPAVAGSLLSVAPAVPAVVAPAPAQ